MVLWTTFDAYYESVTLFELYGHLNSTNCSRALAWLFFLVVKVSLIFIHWCLVISMVKAIFGSIFPVHFIFILLAIFNRSVSMISLLGILSLDV